MRFNRTPSTRNTVKTSNRQRMLVFIGVCIAVGLIAGIVTFLLINFGRNDKAFAAIGNNMGFENNLTEWTNVNGTWTVNTSATYVRTGTKSAKATWTNGSDIEMRNTSSTMSAPNGSSGRLVVMAHARSNNSNGRVRIGIHNPSTNTTTWSSNGYTSITSTGFTRVSAVFQVANNTTWIPVVSARGQGGSTDVYVDDVHIYATTVAVADETVPEAPQLASISTSGNNITLTWANGNDNESGIDGVTIIRYNAAFTPDQTLNDQATYHTTNATVGPTNIGSWKVVYNGAAITTFTDNTGAAGVYTYKIFMRDKALNYTLAASAARVFVLNGNSSTASIASNASLSGLFIGQGCTLTNLSGSTFTIRTNGFADVYGTLVHQGNIVTEGSLNIKDGGVYQHNQDGGAVATANWESGSTCEIKGVKFVAPTNLSQTYHHFVWNSNSQSKQQDLPAGIVTNGNFTLQDSGPGASDRIVWLNGLLTVRGNFSVGTLSEFKVRPGSYLKMNGSTLQTLQVIGSASRFNAIEIDNSGAGVQLLTNTSIDSLCRMTNGTFDLNSRTFLHANNATIVKGLGTMSNGNFAPTNASFVYNLVYERMNTTDKELSASTSYLNNLTINTPANESVTLDKTANVNGTLTLNGGKFITGSNEIHVRNSAVTAVSILNTNSYVQGNLRRNVLNSGTLTYLFPVGNASNVQLAEARLLNMTGFSNLLTSFNGSHNGSAPNCWVNGTNVNTLLNNGFWTVTPNTTPTGGTYSITLHAKGATNPVSIAKQYAILKRVNSTNPWKSEGAHDMNTQSQSGGIATAVRSTLSSFGDFAIGFGNSVLPITLSSFNATLKADNSVMVTWSTSAEVNNAFFSLERSVNGIDFEMINEQDGAGVSTTLLHYSYNDLHPVSGVNYYRLKQTDFDGTFTYGPVRQVTLGTTSANNGFPSGELNIYPNPSTGVFTLSTKNKTEIASVKVFDVKGQMVSQKTFTPGAPMQLDLTSQPTGVYMATITNADQQSTTVRLIVAR